MANSDAFKAYTKMKKEFIKKMKSKTYNYIR